MGTFVLRITGVVTTVFDTLDQPRQAVALVPNLVRLVASSQVPTSPIQQDAAGRPLLNRPHMAFLRYPSAQVQPIFPAPGRLPPETVLRYLNRHRISFTFGGEPSPEPLVATAATTAPGRQWQTYTAGALTTDALREDLSNVANISEITGRTVDSAHLDVHPGTEVLAQVMIGGVGRLKAFPPENNLRWELRSLIYPDPITRPLSHAMLWEVNGVDEVEVHFAPLDPVPGGAQAGSTSFRVAVSDGAPMVMTLANLCTDNPLEWTVNHETAVDEDLLWSFALLDSAAGIAAAARAADLQPMALAPRPVVPLGGGSSGSNCRDQTARARDGAVARLHDSVGN